MQRMRKVLFLVENAPVPGDPRVWNEAVTLAEANYQVSIIAPLHSAQPQPCYASIDGIHIYRFRLPKVRHRYLAYPCEYSVALCCMFWLSLKIWRRHGFDVIHAANPPDLMFLIVLFYRCLGKKFVFDQHDLSPELLHVIFQGRAASLERFLRMLERCSYRLAHVVLVTNESFRKIALERGECRSSKVFVVRNGPRTRKLNALLPERQAPFPARKKYVLAYVGLMGKQDSVENALYSLHHLVYMYGRRDVCLVLIGDGSALAMLKTLARRLALEDYTFFTGWLAEKELADYLASADIGLVPDPRNGLNEYCTMLKVMDYMAAGLPIVSFDLEETRVSARDAALYAQSNSIDDFACQIERLLVCESLRHAMGEHGRQRVREQLNWEYSAQVLLAAYETLFARG